MNYWIELFNRIYFSQFPAINALVIFLIGVILSFWGKHLSLSFLKKIHFDNMLNRIGINEWFNNPNIHTQVIKFIGFLIQAFFIIFFFMISSEIINLNALTNLSSKIILYYSNIFISIIIFITAVFAIDFSQKIVIGTKKFKTITYSRYFAKAIDWSIRILTVLAILYQLQIIPNLITIIFTGVILSLSLIIGISLGLASKEPMARLLKEIKNILKFFN